MAALIVLAVCLILVSTLLYVGIAMFPIALLVSLVGNINVLHDIFVFLNCSSIFTIITGVTISAIIYSEHTPDGLKTHSMFKLITRSIIPISLIILVTVNVLNLIIPKNKENLMFAVGAQIVYNSDTAKQVLTSGSVILVESMKYFEKKAKNLNEDSNETNNTKKWKSF